MTTGTPSAAARTSNSRPSQADTESAAVNAAKLFSDPSRQSPRCAKRSGRVSVESTFLGYLETSARPTKSISAYSKSLGPPNQARPLTSRSLSDLKMSRDPEMVAREDPRVVRVGTVEHEQGIHDPNRPTDPDVVDAPWLAIRVDGRPLEP